MISRKSRMSGIHRFMLYESDDKETVKAMCFYCSQNFKYSLAVQIHLSSHIHPSLKTMRTLAYLRNPFYKCISCSSRIYYRDDVFEHLCFSTQFKEMESLKVKLCEGGPPNFCLNCNAETFQSTAHLLFHLIVQHARHDDPYRCPICGTIFRSGSKLAMELHCFEVHVPQQVYKERRRLLDKGDRTKAQKIFSCLCSNRNTLTYNELTHNRKCDCSFVTLAKLSAHVVAQHSVTSVPKQTKTHFQFNCHFCRIGYPNHDELYLHMNTYHEYQFDDRLKKMKRIQGFENLRNPDYLCYFCWFSFSKREELQAHIVSSHSVESWRICGLCGHEYWKDGVLVKPQLWWMYLQAHERHHGSNLRDHVRQMMIQDNVDDKVEDKKTFPEDFSFFSHINIVDSKEKLKRVNLPTSLPTEMLVKLHEIRERREENEEDFVRV